MEAAEWTTSVLKDETNEGNTVFDADVQKMTTTLMLCSVGYFQSLLLTLRRGI